MVGRDKDKARVYQKAHRESHKIVDNQVRILKRLRERLDKLDYDAGNSMAKPMKAGKERKITKKVDDERRQLVILMNRQQLYVAAVKGVMKEMKGAESARAKAVQRPNVLSKFVEVRQANILRNEAYLRELGILGNKREESTETKVTKELSAAVAVSAGQVSAQQFWLRVGDAFLEVRI